MSDARWLDRDGWSIAAPLTGIPADGVRDIGAADVYGSATPAGPTGHADGAVLKLCACAPAADVLRPTGGMRVCDADVDGPSRCLRVESGGLIGLQLESQRSAIAARLVMAD